MLDSQSETQNSMIQQFFNKNRLSKRPSLNTLNEEFNDSTFKMKVLYFLVENNISFEVVSSKIFKDLLLYCRRYVFLII
jgi:hypothetical protein